jgi:hypothetical protein
MTKLSSKPVKLTVDGKALTFHSLQGFEFCLDARTEVSAAKVADLLKQPVESLRREGQSIRKVEGRFMSVLTQNMEHPETLLTDMVQLDRQLSSQDYRWRTIVLSLDKAPVMCINF